MGDANLPIILIADVYESTLTPAQMAEYDRYVGAQLAIAQGLTLNEPALKVQLTKSFTPAVGDRFRLLASDSIAGEFAPDPPDPPAPPPAPTISVTSGASQSITLPNSPAPIAFTLNGSGALTVTASSSNATVLPDSAISISSGCGSTTLDCTMTLAAESEQTGSTTVSLTVSDAHVQSAAAFHSVGDQSSRRP